MLKSTPKCHKLTLEVLKVNIFRFKMQNDPIWAYNQMAKKSKIDLWEIAGCAQIQEIERPACPRSKVWFKVWFVTFFQY
jgi:hypothetical protein